MASLNQIFQWVGKGVAYIAAFGSISFLGAVGDRLFIREDITKSSTPEYGSVIRLEGTNLGVRGVRTANDFYLLEQNALGNLDVYRLKSIEGSGFNLSGRRRNELQGIVDKYFFKTDLGNIDQPKDLKRHIIKIDE